MEVQGRLSECDTCENLLLVYLGLRGRLLVGVRIVEGVDGRGRENARYGRLRFGVLGVDLADFFVGTQLEPSSSRMRD